MIKQSINKIEETWKRIVLILVKIYRSCYPIMVAKAKRWLQIIIFSLVHACFSSHQEVKFMVFSLNSGWSCDCFEQYNAKEYLSKTSECKQGLQKSVSFSFLSFWILLKTQMPCNEHPKPQGGAVHMFSCQKLQTSNWQPISTAGQVREPSWTTAALCSPQKTEALANIRRGRRPSNLV